MELFEVDLHNARGARNRILVVAHDVAEAEALVRRHAGEIAKITSYGGFTVRGDSRVIGSVELHVP
jgi:hypothetical protein